MTQAPSELAKVHHNLGNVYYRKGDYTSAIKNYLKSIKLNDSNYKVYYDLACAFGSIKEFNNAILNYNKALKLKHNDVYTLNSLAQAYLSTGNIEKARHCAETLFKNDPNLAKNILNRINCAN